MNPRTTLALRMVLAALAVALAARIDVPVPGSPVPQSLQTLAVALAGALLGARAGAGAILLYVGMGAVGLPVFADGAGGWSSLVGPTGGYLGGFVLGAALAGVWRDRGGAAGWGSCLAGMVLAHGVILACGWARLAQLVGPTDAWGQGVAPFLVGGLVKSVVAALVVVPFERSRPVEPDRAGV